VLSIDTVGGIKGCANAAVNLDILLSAIFFFFNALAATSESSRTGFSRKEKICSIFFFFPENYFFDR
jgi:hypothetical protein